MNLTVNQTPQIKGKITLPASKSYSIRAFIVAACGGKSTIINPSDCDDALVAIRVAEALGAKITQKKDCWIVQADLASRNKTTRVNVGESGTALRFLLPLLSLRGKKVVVMGEGTLRGRPNLFLNQTLRSMGVDIRGKGAKESVPITIQGGELKGGHVSIDGSLSSQFISALLISCPRLKEDTRLTLIGKKLVSLDYITMTRQVLNECGIQIKEKDCRNYFIPGGQKYKGFKNFQVPSDYGLAAFLMAAAALVKSDVVFKGNLKDRFIQADGHILKLLKRMGVRFKKTDSAISMKGPFNLKGGEFSLKDCPDLVPIMSVLALFAQGKTRLYGIAHARAKESDRISDLRHELLKVGAKIEERDDELIIYPQATYKTHTTLDPHSDHRLAMSFSVLGLKLAVTVKDIECSRKSYPQFVQDFKSLGI
jgi:3-phosphoshikimate 1-carboxyvinyltransferase